MDSKAYGREPEDEVKEQVLTVAGIKRRYEALGLGFQKALHGGTFFDASVGRGRKFMRFSRTQPPEPVGYDTLEEADADLRRLEGEQGDEIRD